jgi:hypothetical protein
LNPRKRPSTETENETENEQNSTDRDRRFVHFVNDWPESDESADLLLKPLFNMNHVFTDVTKHASVAVKPRVLGDQL